MQNRETKTENFSTHQNSNINKPFRTQTNYNNSNTQKQQKRQQKALKTQQRKQISKTLLERKTKTVDPKIKNPDLIYTFIEKADGAPPWGRKRGRSDEKEPKAKELAEEEEDSKRGPMSLPRPPPGLKLNPV